MPPDDVLAAVPKSVQLFVTRSAKDRHSLRRVPSRRVPRPRSRGGAGECPTGRLREQYAEPNGSSDDHDGVRLRPLRPVMLVDEHACDGHHPPQRQE